MHPKHRQHWLLTPFHLQGGITRPSIQLIHRAYMRVLVVCFCWGFYERLLYQIETGYGMLPAKTSRFIRSAIDGGRCILAPALRRCGLDAFATICRPDIGSRCAVVAVQSVRGYFSLSVTSDQCSLRLFCSCYGCAFELSTGIETEQYIQYMLRKVTMIRSCGVATVVLVFDGQRLLLKIQTTDTDNESCRDSLTN